MNINVVRILSVVGASYGVSALVGAFAAGIIFLLVAGSLAWDAIAMRHAVLPFLAAGPAVASALTFLSRRLIDLTVRISPDSVERLAVIEPVSSKLKAALAIVIIASGASFLAIGITGSDTRLVKPAGQCKPWQTC